MNTKRFFLAVLIVFILFELTNYLIHGVILSSYYMTETVQQVFRSEEMMSSNMWIIWVTDLIWSFFFVLIFIKGYEGKGIKEGLKFGLYIGIFYSLVIAFQSYAMYPLPYGLTFQWFLFGLIQAVILGFITALIYKPEESVATEKEFAVKEDPA